jgi:hypothetical protein
MLSLQARRKKSASASRSKSQKKTTPRLLDLDNYDESDGDGEGPDDLIAKEHKQLELLDRALTNCARCGPDKYCKIDKAGDHVHLSFQQRRGWANALV